MSYFNYKGSRLWYSETGQGKPLLLLHGNTASSAMFDGLIDLYAKKHLVLTIDFSGHGRSQRLEEFPLDLWYDEAMQAIALLEEKKYGPVDIIGTSGGAIAALNIALERPNLVGKLIADSFEGESSLDAVIDFIVADREQAKGSKDSIEFWQYMHGDDWEPVVDNDTKTVIRHHREISAFFHKSLSECRAPVLLTASLEDEFFSLADIKGKYKSMSEKIPCCETVLFPHGRHPAFLSCGEQFAEVAEKFFNK